MVIMSEKAPQTKTKAVTKPKTFDILVKGRNSYSSPEARLKGVDQQNWTEEHFSLEELVTVS